MVASSTTPAQGHASRLFSSFVVLPCPPQHTHIQCNQESVYNKNVLGPLHREYRVPRLLVQFENLNEMNILLNWRFIVHSLVNNTARLNMTKSYSFRGICPLKAPHKSHPHNGSALPQIVEGEEGKSHQSQTYGTVKEDF